MLADTWHRCGLSSVNRADKSYASTIVTNLMVGRLHIAVSALHALPGSGQRLVFPVLLLPLDFLPTPLANDYTGSKRKWQR